MKRLIYRGKTKFVTAERLGSGLLAVVYAAGDGTERIAVKLPAPNLPAEQLKRFEEEYYLLTELRKRLHAPSVPVAWWGEDEETSSPVLLLEMAPDTKLNEHLQQQEGWRREELALKAALQYASLLQQLHTLPRAGGGEGYTCTDRKMGDLRWNPETEHLVVLDWNAVRPKQDNGVHEDINTFAALWYQILTKSYARNDLRLLDDAAWAAGQVSIGTRVIILRALSAQYLDAAELFNDIQAWLDDIQRSNEHLYQQGIEALGKATMANKTAQTSLNAIRQQNYTSDTVIPELALDEENNALRYLDFARRKGVDETEEDYQKALGLVQNQGDRLVTNAALAFEITQYDLAKQNVDWANRTLSQAEQLPTITSKLQLRVKRWQLLFHAGLIAIDKTDISLRNIREKLTNAVRQLEQVDDQISPQIEDWQAAQSSMEYIANDMDRQHGSNPVTSLLNLFIVEAQCHILLIKVEEKTASGAYEEAGNFLQDIQIKLAIEIADEPAQAYLVALQHETAFTNLDARIRKLRHKARTTSIAQKLIDDLSGPITAPATYILQRLEDARYFFADDLDTLSEIEAHNKLPSIILLAQLDHHQQTGQWQESIQDIEQLVQTSDKQIREAVAPFISKVIQHIKELIDSQENDLLTLGMLDSLMNLQSPLLNLIQEHNMTTLDKDLFAGLTDLRQELNTRIQRREEILRSINHGSIQVGEGIQKAKDKDIQLFNKQDLPLKVLQGQFDTLDKMVTLVKKKRTQIDTAQKTLNNINIEEKRAVIDQTVGMGYLQQADVALYELEIEKVNEFLGKFKKLDTQDDLKEWHRELKADMDWLSHLKNDSTPYSKWDDLRECMQCLVKERKRLNGKQWRFLNQLNGAHENSRLLSKYKWLDSSYPRGTSSTTRQNLGSHVSPIKELTLNKLPHAFRNNDSVDELEKRLFSINKWVKQTVQNSAMPDVLNQLVSISLIPFTDSWLELIHNSSYIRETLQELKELAGSIHTEQQLKICVTRLNQLIKDANDMAFHPHAQDCQDVLKVLGNKKNIYAKNPKYTGYLQGLQTEVGNKRVRGKRRFDRVWPSN